MQLNLFLERFIIQCELSGLGPRPGNVAIFEVLRELDLAKSTVLIHAKGLIYLFDQLLLQPGPLEPQLIEGLHINGDTTLLHTGDGNRVCPTQQSSGQVDVGFHCRE